MESQQQLERSVLSLVHGVSLSIVFSSRWPSFIHYSVFPVIVTSKNFQCKNYLGSSLR